MAYVDEALKLDARALMDLAMQTGRQGTYEVRLSYPTGHVKCGDLRENPDRVVSAYITVKWPTRAGDPASGDVLVGYRLWGDRPAAQTVTLTGTPAKVGGWLWRFTCRPRAPRVDHSRYFRDRSDAQNTKRNLQCELAISTSSRDCLVMVQRSVK
jgi:hypothetical protein